VNAIDAATETLALVVEVEPTRRREICWLQTPVAGLWVNSRHFMFRSGLEDMRVRLSRRITMATLFGVLVFVSKILIPTPFDKMAIAPQALLLTLGFLSIGPLGATYVAAIGGLLSAAWRAPFAPFTMAFALMYGLLIDGFCYAVKIKGSQGSVRKGRLVGAVTLSTVIVGLSSYYVTVFVFSILPRNPLLEFIILIVGTLNGVIAAYLTLLVWSRVREYLGYC
jgi:hypothetical protein